MSSNASWNRESGASLVAVLVSIALFGTVAVMSSQSFRNISFAGRRADSVMSAREVENLIMQEMTQKFRKYVAEGCSAAPHTFFQHADNNKIGSFATIQHKNPRFYDADNNTVSAPALADSDITRCNTLLFSGSLTPDKANSFYGCFDLKTDSATRDKAVKANKDAFAANRGAFVEMYVKLRNLQTDELIECNKMLAKNGFGLEVYYNLHWTMPAGDKLLYDSKLGSFNVAY